MSLVELGSGGARHIFYHHATVIDKSDGHQLPCFATDPDEEGFSLSHSGSHQIPFSMRLPVGKGAKGCLKCKQGVVKYIVIGFVFSRA